METAKSIQRPLFTSKSLLALLVPLVIERFLDMTVGAADTIMVSAAGEAAVSGVSLVDNVNNLIVFLLAALASGGAVVISQYLGRDESANARLAAKQLFYSTLFASLVLMIPMLLLRKPLLALLFGKIDADVMQSAQTYFWITAFSYPFIAVYNSLSAVFRSMGNSKVSMITSLLMNVINLGGNALLVYGFHWGAAGVATATLASRIVAALAVVVLIRNPRNIIFINKLHQFSYHAGIVKNILRIGIPSSIENGLFHFGRLLVQGVINTMGTTAIAANAVAGKITALTQIPGSAIQLGIITVVGFCIGAGDYDQAAYNGKKLILWTYISTTTLCVLVYLLRVPSIAIFRLNADVTALATTILISTMLPIILIWPLAFPLPNIIRAAGDAKYTMIVSIGSMLLVRFGMSYVLGVLLHMDLLGAWLAMYADWFVRGVAFSVRFISGKWKTKTVIT